MTSYTASFESYGARFSIISNDERTLIEACEVAITALLGQIERVGDDFVEHVLSVEKVEGGVSFKMDGQDHGVTPWPKLAHFFDTCVRILVAEYAVDRVFLHSGVVTWKGKSIVFPGDSYTGKTTMVAEFVKRGAVYYSDEYAIIDESGLVHPFARPLSIRHPSDFSIRNETSAESLGGSSGNVPVAIDYIFLLNYVKGSRFRPKLLTRSEAVMQILPQAIPLRFNPKLTLLLLNKVCRHAMVFKGQRNSSKIVVDRIIDLIDKLQL